MRDFDGGFCKGFGWPCTHRSHAHGKKGGKALILKKTSLPLSSCTEKLFLSNS